MFLIFFFKHILYPPAAGRFRLKISAGGSSERKKQKLEPVFFPVPVFGQRERNVLSLFTNIYTGQGRAAPKSG